MKIADALLGTTSVAVAVAGILLLARVRASAGELPEPAPIEEATEESVADAPGPEPVKSPALPPRSAPPKPFAAKPRMPGMPMIPERAIDPSAAEKAREYFAEDPGERARKLLEKVHERTFGATEEAMKAGKIEEAFPDDPEQAVAQRRLASEERRARALQRRLRNAEKRGNVDERIMERDARQLDKLSESIGRRRSELGLGEFKLPEGGEDDVE